MATPFVKNVLHSTSLLKFCRPISSSASAPSPPPADQPPVVSAAVSLLTQHRSKSRWNYLRSLLSSSALSPTYFSQIALQLKSNPHLAVRFFDFTVRNSLCLHDRRSYATIIHILSRARQKARAESIIRAALRSPDSSENGNSPLKLFEVLVKTYRECDSAPFVFDLLIITCLELKKIDGALEIVRMLRSRGISPQIRTCNLLVRVVSRCRGSNEGYGVFREVFGLESNEREAKMAGRVAPNVHSFNALMMGFYKDGNFEMVEEIWSEIGRFGCVADRDCYSVMMAVFCEEGRISEAEILWEEMKLKGIQPDIMAYNTIIGGFCQIGKVEIGEELFREMELKRIEGSALTFEHLINGYCRIGDVDSAMLVNKDMCRKDFFPEVSTIEMLIGGLCEKQRVSEALKVLRMKKKDVVICPSEKSYELLIKGLCEDGNMEEALKLQAEMVGKGFKPNSKLYATFIEGYMKLGNEEMVAVLRKEMSETQKQKEED